MVEYSPIEALLNIHADIAYADEEAKKADQIKENLAKKSRELYKQADGTLRWGGNTESGFVGVGSGRSGVLDFRLERGDRLETPPVTVEFGGKKAELVLSEVLKGSAFSLKRDGIQLTAKFNDDPAKEKKQIFYMDTNGESKNWLGETATLDQMDMIKGILSSMRKFLPKMRKFLPKGNRPEDLRGVLQKTTGKK